MTQKREEGYQEALKQARAALQKLDPYKTAFTAGCDYLPAEEGGEIPMRFCNEPYVISFPGLQVLSASGKEPDTATRLILLHYLLHADGSPPADHWIAFRELRDGMVYDPAFQKRSSLRIAQEYGHDAKGFRAAAESLGGERLSFGDASYMFRLLPRVRMAVILYEGDEEFGPRVNVLFDAAAEHYLPIEDLAVLGGILASKLIKAGQR
jgi:hypothetical protein